MGETGSTGREVTAESLLATAEQAFLQAEFDVVRPLLQRLRSEFGAPDTGPADVRYGILLAAMAARAGNWPAAVRLCPDVPDGAEIGISHFLAVHALRELAREDRHTSAGVAAVVIVLWAHLLDEEYSGGFRALLTEQRGEPLPDTLWEQAVGRLRGRLADLLGALDARAGRDALAAWHTAWEAECAGGVVVFSDIPADAGAHALISLVDAAWHLVDHGRGADLLAAAAARHPGFELWPEDTHRPGARYAPLARALAERGSDRLRGSRWDEALTDFAAAVRFGHTLTGTEKDSVVRAWRNVGRSWNGHGNDLRVRIAGLEAARPLLPHDTTLAAELTAELVRRGRDVALTDPHESRDCFTRALAVTPGDPHARAGLDDHLRAELRQLLHRTDERKEPEISAGDVRSLLARDPGCEPARLWLRRHHQRRGVAAAVDGRLEDARDAAREMLRYADPRPSHSSEDVDNTFVFFLFGAVGRIDRRSRAGLELRVELLRTAAEIPTPVQSRSREDLHEAILHLAEYLEAAGAVSDIIELFLRDLMRTGVSTRFDKVVESAYALRASVRRKTGDLGGAQRDLACAEAISEGLPLQTPLFGAVTGKPHRDDPRQDTLF
ncbi:hypothetical protein ABTX80_19470 [Streptomyces erythrochromogenes]|uniref:hypothetical protein n=1 Tax=Streptomyces erythrochromogenes TaxID=285574 RepID=UPI003321223C